MKTFNHALLAAALLLCFGCSHPNRVRSEAPADVVTVYVGGAVNTPGKLELTPPFSITHAIEQAGGLSPFEQRQNRQIVIRRKDSPDVYVPRKDYVSFTLADGDALFVPRH